MTIITKSATVENAREVVKKLHDRNRSTWNDLDREIVFAINALVADSERLRYSCAIAAAAERQRLHDKFMEMHKAQQHSNNYWHFAARKIMEES